MLDLESEAGEAWVLFPLRGNILSLVFFCFHTIRTKIPTLAFLCVCEKLDWYERLYYVKTKNNQPQNVTSSEHWTWNFCLYSLTLFSSSNASYDNITNFVFSWKTNIAIALYGWTVPQDTVPTNVYTSSYLSHHTVQYGVHSLAGQQSSRITVAQTQATSRAAH